MNLLTGKLYDPGTAVNKATNALLAMTAFDTTNLRLSFTVPASGIVLVRMRTCLSGATTMPQVLLGVLEGSTVKGRQAPQATLSGTAVATTIVHLRAEFLVTGLTPGASLNWDAAYGVETLVASTNIRYGGPNDTTGNNAWGGFAFEIWDPQPQTTTGQLQVDSAGRVDVSKVAGTTQTARDLGGQLDAAVSTRLAPTVAGRTLDVSAGGEAGVDWANVGSPTTAVNLSGTTISTTQAIASVSGAVGSVTGAVGSVTAPVTVGTNNDKTGYGLTAAYDAAKTALPASSYVAPDNASIATILTRTDVATSTRLASASYTIPPTATEISDAVLYTPMTESYNAKGSDASIAQVGYTLLAQLGETAIVDTTKTLYKLDGVTVAKTFTLNSATVPTAITRAT